MIHNRRKSHKKTPFKSSTDINNYNTFLKKLDKKQSEKNEPQIIENKPHLFIFIDIITNGCLIINICISKI